MTETDPAAPHPAVPGAPRPPLALGSVTGLLCGAVGIASGSLVAAMAEVAGPVKVVGNAVIERAPATVKDLAIEIFGTANKTALQVGIVIVLAIIAALLGAQSLSTPVPLLIGITVTTVCGALAATDAPMIEFWSVISPVIGGVAALAVAPHLLTLLGSTWSTHWWRRRTPGPSRVPLGWDRRRFVRHAMATSGATVIIGSVALAGDRRRNRRLAAQIPDTLPPLRPTEGPAPLPEVTVAEVPFITPTTDFYRIDTALSFPSVDLDKWTLRIGGLVDRPIELSYADLQRLPQLERVVTICCVSNEVGGPYIGNAVWQGVALGEVLRRCGVQSSAEQVFSVSLDGWTSGFPVDVALDGRDALIAIGMNGEPLPLRHGFPARLIVPGLYGYVSATKWLSEIRINRWDDAEGFWIPRGWARDAPIKTQSRIDVPRRGQTVPAGIVTLAGVAWAPHTGVAAVEVRIDGGEWLSAELSSDVTDDAWRVWRLSWAATSGTHTVQVRATDKSGYVQTDAVRPVAPDGATGWHTRQITVT